jgi:hypothetical protein
VGTFFVPKTEGMYTFFYRSYDVRPFLAVFLGGKTCCPFDCNTYNVDKAIEDK